MSRLSVILTASAVSLFALPAMAVPTLFFGNNKAPVPSLAGTSASKTAQTNWLSSFTSSLRQDQDTFTQPVSPANAPISMAFDGGASVVISSATVSPILSIETAPTGNGHYSTAGGATRYILAQLRGLTFNFAAPVTALGFYATDMGDGDNPLRITVKNGATTLLNNVQISCGLTPCVPTTGQNGARTFVGVTADVGTFFDFVSFNIAGGLVTDSDVIGFDTVIVAAPEPSSLAVLGFAAAAMVGSLRLTKKRARTAAPLPA